MEVHKHPHHVTHKKQWREYLLEFLMIFFAVTAGFFAESFREKRVERSHEIEYIRSLYEDLQSDSSHFAQAIGHYNRKIIVADSLMLLWSSITQNGAFNDLYFLSREVTRDDHVGINDRTIIQLRNAGGMRLIENKKLPDSLYNYYKEADQLEYLWQRLLVYYNLIAQVYPSLFNGVDYDQISNSSGQLVRPSRDLTMRSLNLDSINSCTMYLAMLKAIYANMILHMTRMIDQSKNMENLISQEYNM